MPSRFLEYSLYLFAFLLPLQTRLFLRLGELNGGYSEYLTISLYGSDLLLLFILVLYLVNYIKGRTLKVGSGEVKIIFLLIIIDAVAFISVLVAPDKLLSAYTYLRLVLGLGLFWVLGRSAYRKNWLYLCFIIGMVLEAAIGIWQFLWQDSFGNKWLGAAAQNASDLGVSVIETAADGRWLRAFGTLPHPNILGGFLALAILFTIIIIRSQAPKSFKLIAVSSFMVLFAGLDFSFSRSAWLALVLALAVWLLSAVKERDFVLQRSLLEIILIAGILSLVFYGLLGDVFLARFSTGTRLEAKSAEERIESLGDGCEIFKNSWSTGIGIGNYPLALSRIKPGRDSYVYQPVHNAFILMAAEIGALGLLAFLALLFILGKRLYNAKNPLIYAWLVFLVIAMFDHWLWSLHAGVYLTWFILGAGYGESLPVNKKINNKKFSRI